MMQRKAQIVHLLAAFVSVVLVLSGCAIQPVQPTTVADPQTIVEKATAPWRPDLFDKAAAEITLGYFADDAVVTLVGVPGGPEIHTGRADIAAWLKALLEQNFRMTVEVTGIEGDTVHTLTHTWIDPTRAMGVAPLDATEEYVVKDGLIQSETWTITPESQQKLMAAIAAAQATVGAPAASIDAVAGRWTFEAGGAPYQLTLGADGSYRVGSSTLADDSIDHGEFSLSDGVLSFLTANDDCAQTPQGRYNAILMTSGDAVTGLQLAVIEDSCESRRDALDGVTLPPAK